LLLSGTVEVLLTIINQLLYILIFSQIVFVLDGRVSQMEEINLFESGESDRSLSSKQMDYEEGKFFHV